MKLSLKSISMEKWNHISAPKIQHSQIFWSILLPHFTIMDTNSKHTKCPLLFIPKLYTPKVKHHLYSWFAVAFNNETYFDYIKVLYELKLFSPRRSENFLSLHIEKMRIIIYFHNYYYFLKAKMISGKDLRD